MKIVKRKKSRLNSMQLHIIVFNKIQNICLCVRLVLSYRPQFTKVSIATATQHMPNVCQDENDMIVHIIMIKIKSCVGSYTPCNPLFCSGWVG